MKKHPISITIRHTPVLTIGEPYRIISIKGSPTVEGPTPAGLHRVGDYLEEVAVEELCRHYNVTIIL